MIGYVYFVIIVLVSIIGAVAGLGGGVIMRPIFDAIGYHDVLNIGFLGSTAIVTMAVVSTLRKMKSGFKADFKIVLLISAGAVFGGVLGNMSLEALVRITTASQQIQSALTVIVLTFCIFATYLKPKFKLQNGFLYVFLGVILGAVATFLGIGGGPINVPILIIFFSMPIKDATTYSIMIIFFSHVSRLVAMGMGDADLDYTILPFIISAAAVGGLIGGKLSNVLSEKSVRKVFRFVILAVIVLNVVNILFLLGE